MISLLPGCIKDNVRIVTRIDGTRQYEVASEHNVIVFVIDTFGNLRLQNALEAYPGIADGLEDFTYYDNADCHYYCTFPSLTHMLTGAEFEFDQMKDSLQWLDESWSAPRAESFYQLLHAKGYKCNLFSPAIKYVYGSADNLKYKFDNVIESEFTVDTVHLFKLFTKMSIYRYVPYIVKPYFEVLTHWFQDVIIYDKGTNVQYMNTEFYDKLVGDGLTVDRETENALIIQSLFGLHTPYTTDENCREVEQADAVQTAAGCMLFVQEYIDQLKELGVYDSATIIVTADHASWNDTDKQPILLVKLPNESHAKMQVSSAPVSHDDFQATILASIGAEYTDFGTSIWDWKDGDIRERTVYMRVDDGNYEKVEGSDFSVYYGYTYSTDINELMSTVEDGPDVIRQATPWKRK